MRLTLKSSILLVAVVAMFVATAAGLCGQDSSQDLVSIAKVLTGDVVAKGKGFQVTQAELDDAYIRASVSIFANGKEVPIGKERAMESELLEQLVMRKIYLQLATPEDVQNGEATYQNEVLRRVRDAGGKDEFAFRIFLAGWSSADSYLQDLHDSCVCNAYQYRVCNNVEATSEEAKQLYDSNPKSYRVQKESFYGGYILFSRSNKLTGERLSDEAWALKKQSAAEVLKQAKAGGDFAALMQAFSDDPRSRDRGMMVFRRGSLDVEAEQAAFALKNGGISDLVEAWDALYIVKVISLRKAGIIPFSDVEESLIAQLTAERRQKMLTALSVQLCKDFQVQFLKGHTAP